MLSELENIDDDDPNQYDIYVTPPNDTGNITDEDSGEDDSNDPDRLNKNQLLAEAELYINNTPAEEFQNQDQDLEDDDNNSKSCNVTENIVAPARKSKKSKKEVRTWVDGDLQKPLFAEWTGSFPMPLTFSSSTHPLDFFELFITKEVIDDIVRNTVTYAASQNRTLTLSSSEMYTFVGILFLSGYNILPRRRMYWEESSDVQNILVSKSMRRRRFEEIFRNLHLVNNDVIDRSDKMAKVRPLINVLNEKFLKYMPIEQSLSVDESMIPYFGRHGCKQFIRGKPIRFGFKAWVLALRLGYCAQLDIYQGRRKDGEVEFGLGEHVVMKFADILKEHYDGIQFSLYFDNFFTSAKLVTSLGEKGFAATGTVRQNRTENCGLPDDAFYKKKDRGSYDTKLDPNHNIVAVRWKDNSNVTLLSNQFGANPVQKASRYSAKDKAKINIPQPNVISLYNRNMGGVDQMDNNISNYRISMRGKKWYMPIILWLFDVAMNNAWHVARSCGLSLDNLSFRREVVNALLAKYGTAPLRSGPTSTRSYPLPARINASHIILTDLPRRRCVVCKNKTIKGCSTCEVALHDKCFAIYHK